MAGEYRQESVLQQLPPEVATKIRNGLRIALTSQPIINMVVRNDLSELLAQAYESIPEARKYAVGLRNRSMVPVENRCPGTSPDPSNKVWAPGELFFAS